MLTRTDKLLNTQIPVYTVLISTMPYRWAKYCFILLLVIGPNDRLEHKTFFSYLLA